MSKAVKPMQFLCANLEITQCCDILEADIEIIDREKPATITILYKVR